MKLAGKNLGTYFDANHNIFLYRWIVIVRVKQSNKKKKKMKRPNGPGIFASHSSPALGP